MNKCSDVGGSGLIKALWTANIHTQSKESGKKRPRLDGSNWHVRPHEFPKLCHPFLAKMEIISK